MYHGRTDCQKAVGGSETSNGFSSLLLGVVGADRLAVRPYVVEERDSRSAFRCAFNTCEQLLLDAHMNYRDRKRNYAVTRGPMPSQVGVDWLLAQRYFSSS